MLAEQFRSSPDRVGRMRELLGDPTLAAAIVTVQDEKPDGDVPRNSDAIESVRALSIQTGWMNAINMLLSLSEPLLLPPVEEEPFAHLLEEK